MLPGIDLYMAADSALKQNYLENEESAIIYGYSESSMTVPGKNKKEEMKVP